MRYETIQIWFAHFLYFLFASAQIDSLEEPTNLWTGNIIAVCQNSCGISQNGYTT
jgi:hypothetical protein